MDESLNSSNNNDISLSSRETESNSTISTSFESQCQISETLKTQIINAITANLKEIIEENKQNGGDKYMIRDIFYLQVIPSISLKDYIKRLVKYTKMNISTLILSIIYIDRFCEKYKYVLSYNNIYRLLLISTLISIKFNEDIMVNTKTYSNIAGVSVSDLNFLEYRMCIALDFSFNVKSDYYQQYFTYFSKFTSKDKNNS